MSAKQWSGRWSGRVESPSPTSAEPSRSARSKANDYSRFTQTSGSRVSTRRLLAMAAALSDRDRRVLHALRRVRVLTGAQLERLLFASVAGQARGRVRRRVLQRLVGSGLVVALERRVGGVRAGSAGLVYALSAAGQRLLDGEDGRDAPRRRQPHTPGALFLAHALAVAEVYISLTEAVRVRPGLRVTDFAVERDARWTVAGALGRLTLRPDALVVLESRQVEDVWWLELDRSTESLPRVRDMLGRYLSFAESGLTGPRGVVPRVVISVPDEGRRREVARLIEQMPRLAGELFVVVLVDDVAAFLVNELVSGEVERPP